MSMLETPAEKEFLDASLQKHPKKETLNLSEFEWVTPNQAAVQISRFTHGEDDIPYVYNVTLLLWLHSSKNSGDVPVMMETELWDECQYCASYKGIRMALDIVGDVYTEITVFDENGEELEELNADEIVDGFETADE